MSSYDPRDYVRRVHAFCDLKCYGCRYAYRCEMRQMELRERGARE